MNRKTLVSLTVAVTAGLGALVATETAQAFNFGDMMNPSRWFGGDRDRYYDRYDRHGYGWGGPYGYGGYGGPYGGWGGPYGYGGGPWGGYGYGPYGGWGGPGYGGYGPGSTIVVTPQGGGSSDKQAAPRLPE